MQGRRTSLEQQLRSGGQLVIWMALSAWGSTSGRTCRIRSCNNLSRSPATRCVLSTLGFADFCLHLPPRPANAASADANVALPIHVSDRLYSSCVERQASVGSLASEGKEHGQHADHVCIRPVCIWPVLSLKGHQLSCAFSCQIRWDWARRVRHEASQVPART